VDPSPGVCYPGDAQETHERHIMYETFGHTADVGLRIRAADLNSLFADAAPAMSSVIVTNPESIRSERFVLEADETDALLRRWLAELLYTLSTVEAHEPIMAFWEGFGVAHTPTFGSCPAILS
jgi:hypothetical protein